MFSFLWKIVPSDIREPIVEYAKFGVTSKAEYALLVTISAVAVCFETLGAATVFSIIDFLENDQNISALTEQSTLWFYAAKLFQITNLPITLGLLCFFVFAMVLTRQLAGYVRDIYISKLKERAFQKLTVNCFSAIMSANKLYLQQIGTGTFTNLVYNQCQSAGSIVRGVSNLVTIGLTFMAYGLLLLIQVPAAVLLTGIFGAALLICVSWLNKKARLYSDRLVAHGLEYSDQIAEKYRVRDLIKLSNSVPYETGKVKNSSMRLQSLNVDIAEVSARLQLIVGPLVIGLVMVTLWVSIEKLGQETSRMLVFVLVLMRLMPLVERTAAVRQNINRMGSYVRRIRETIKGATDASEIDEGTETFTALRKAITFSNIEYRYGEGERNILSGVDLDIPAGKTTAITGPTGSGKSTLINLLTRMLVPTSGTVLFDGRQIESFTISSIRQQISFVDQSPNIMNRSLIENIRYGNTDATEEEVMDACQKAKVDEFVENLPNGFETVLGEGGVKLSGGQRQRLALARAFLKKSSVLILDEPTSALDYETESKIQEALETTVRDSDITVIIVAHRLATIRNADHLIVLKDGKVLEEGAPKDMKHSDGWYSSILNLS